MHGPIVRRSPTKARLWPIISPSLCAWHTRVSPGVAPWGLYATGKIGRSTMVHASVGSPACTRSRAMLPLLWCLLGSVFLGSLLLGHLLWHQTPSWPFSPRTCCIPRTWPEKAETVVLAVRLPRAAAAVLVGQLCPWPGPPIRVCSVTRWCHQRCSAWLLVRVLAPRWL